MPDLPAPDRTIALPDGRRLAFDDRGDPAGTPVLYLHGTPDSRLARHPDDGLATAAGVRLVAVDRPGIGGSSIDPGATPVSVADDLVVLLDRLDIASTAVLAWSAGSLFALALAGHRPDRVTRLVLTGPLVPVEAYDDPGVLDGSDDARRLFADVHHQMTPDEVGRELAMWLVPPAIDVPTARELLHSSLEATRGIDGADRQLVAGLRASVAQTLTGVERDVAAQATPLADQLDTITAPVRIHVGADDTTCPPAMARWLGDRLGAPVAVHENQGHALAITAWSELLAEAVGRT